uniref:hypothetical protein n=1 Tax=Escherichia coli TaxID=562 RepID=UPI003D817125
MTEVAMLEIMTAAQAPGFQGPWDGVLPPQDQNTLFRMHTFDTIADVKDKSPNAIAVTNSNVTVGSDVHGSFMKFNGTNSSLAFSSPLLDGNSYDVTFIMGDIAFPSTAQYDVTILDGRPNITNGRYLTWGYSKTLPFRSTISYQGAGVFGTIPVPGDQFPIVYKISVRPGSLRAYANGKMIQEWLLADTAMTGNAPWRVGRNAYVQQAATPWLNGKVYYIDFKKV